MELSDLVRLTERHELSAFDAGTADLDGQSAWLREHGLANDRRGLTRVFVATYAGTMRAAAFFGLAPGIVARDSLPRRLRPHGTPLVIPGILIARLAVDRTLQGQGIGRDLTLAAIGRALRAQEHVGGALVIVDAAGEKAQRLYAHHRFTPVTNITSGTTRMVLPMSMADELMRLP
ncbi:GNAT family N-acetyltransferase [Methylobacterium sp. 17Sr1-1]|uniref:GNAT family N-acetyltransferase n=1 Tax=Methylobacterium sp. 17Sr1-1 TaxID=2202826 RepID=UPI000D6F5D8D|nr:GNAT family N-acetyltransferase [Methylobacterium sp. 17Sr1-1]AWN53674.1 N-acetyltransferase [Methylobacterium sp. 17Sr1-1]